MDIKEIIECEFGLIVHDIFVLGQGLDSIAYLVNDEYVFKQSKNDEAKNNLNKEIAITDRDKDFIYLLENSSEEIGREFGLRVLEYYNHPNINIAILKANLNDEYYPIEQILEGRAKKLDKMYLAGLNKIINVGELKDE